MFWEDCNEPSFDKHIWQPDNFLYLNGKKVIYPRIAEIVMGYIQADENNFGKLTKKPIENQKMFQYVYASVYPEVYSFVEKRGVDMRNNFHLKFKEEKKIAKEKKTKRNGREKTNKKRERRCEIVAKNKELKRIKKSKKDKRDEKEMWARLKELNRNFAKMKEKKI